MSTPKSLTPEILLHLAQSLNLPLRGIVSVIELLDEGGTVPFIARYRKEQTGNLDEVQIRDIHEKLEYFRDLMSRRETILSSIAEQGKLTDQLKAAIAREKGLEPLAQYLWEQKPTDIPLDAYVDSFVNTDLGVATADEALEG